MTRAPSILTAAALMLLASGAVAQEQPPLEAVPEPPPMPEPMQSGQTIEPDVTIVRGDEETVVEYRVNGSLRAVKVIPDVGPPYYLADADGDGNLETKSYPHAPDFLVNQWVIFSW